MITFLIIYTLFIIPICFYLFRESSWIDEESKQMSQHVKELSEYFSSDQYKQYKNKNNNNS